MIVFEWILAILLGSVLLSVLARRIGAPTLLLVRMSRKPVVPAQPFCT
jgi:monovalent cation/hydrogen antiporter